MDKLDDEEILELTKTGFSYEELERINNLTEEEKEDEYKNLVLYFKSLLGKMGYSKEKEEKIMATILSMHGAVKAEKERLKKMGKKLSAKERVKMHKASVEIVLKAMQE